MAVFYPHVWPPCRTAASYCLTSCPRPMMVYELKFQAQYNLQLGKKKKKKLMKKTKVRETSTVKEDYELQCL